MPESETPRLGDDLLVGVQAIADFIGRTPRQAQYLCERGRIPFFRLGSRIAARKSELDNALRAGNAGQAGERGGGEM